MNIIGIDTMYFGLDIEDYMEKYKAILLEIKDKKELGHDVGYEQSIEYNNVKFKVQLTGIPFYAYNLRCKDFSIAFTGRPTATNPEVKIYLSSGFLWSFNYKEAYKNIINWFYYFPGKIKKSRLSRVDICMDTDEIEFFKEDMTLFKTRAKSKIIRYPDDEYYNGKRFSGFTFGRGKPLLARIYNKSEEIKRSGKEWFKTLWNEHGWKGEKDVWRIEFQVRRKALRELGIDSVEDLEEKEVELWNYLVNDWLRMDHEKWEKVKQGKNTTANSLIREKVIQGDIIRLTNQTNGLLISIGAFSGLTNIFDVINYVMDTIQKKLELRGTTFEKEVEKRREQYFK